MNAKVFFRRGKKLNVELDKETSTYLPIRLQNLTSEEGSGILTALLDRTDPVILNDFLAIEGSYLSQGVRG